MTAVPDDSRAPRSWRDDAGDFPPSVAVRAFGLANVLTLTRAVLHAARAISENDTPTMAANGTASGAALSWASVVRVVRQGWNLLISTEIDHLATSLYEVRKHDSDSATNAASNCKIVALTPRRDDPTNIPRLSETLVLLAFLLSPAMGGVNEFLEQTARYFWIRIHFMGKSISQPGELFQET